jgi:4'-phosphopantetheinyl transferase
MRFGHTAIVDSASRVVIDTGVDRGEVDVWRFDLDRLTPGAWPQALTGEDFRRADRFVHETHRNRFLQARLGLRTLLAGYSGVAPRQLEFRFNAHGKPSLGPAYRLGFNLSHSGNLAAIAIGRQRAIGVDIERLTPPADLHHLAQQVFSEEEVSKLAALPDGSLTLPFLVCWTRKESYLKALGVGLARDPRSVTVGLSAIRALARDGLHAGTVEVETIAVEPEAVLSLAVGGGRRDRYRAVRIRHFDPSKKLELRS